MGVRVHMYVHIHVDVFTYMWWLELDTVYLHHSLPYLWMFICMCTCMYVCICVCTCEGQRSVLSVFLSHSSRHLCGCAVYMCVHTHVYVHICIRGACTCMHVHVEMRSWHHVSSSVTLQLTFETGSLVEPGVHESAIVVGQEAPGIHLPSFSLH